MDLREQAKSQYETIVATLTARNLPGGDRNLADIGINPALVAGAAAARASYDATITRIDGVLARLDGGGTPAMTPADWTALCQTPFEALEVLSFSALDNAAERAAEMTADGRRALITDAVIIALLVVAVAVAVLTIRRRFARLSTAIGRLSAGDYDTPIDALNHDGARSGCWPTAFGKPRPACGVSSAASATRR